MHPLILIAKSPPNFFDGQEQQRRAAKDPRDCSDSPRYQVIVLHIFLPPRNFPFSHPILSYSARADVKDDDIDISFRAKFCRARGIPDSEFESAALRALLHFPWSWLSPLISRLAPGLVSTDLQIIQQLGRVESGANLSAELRDIRTEYRRKRDFRLLRRVFKMRLSTQRTFSVSKSFWISHEPFQ